MLDAIWRPWLAAGLRNSPYPERDLPEPKWWDRALTATALAMRNAWQAPGAMPWLTARAALRLGADLALLPDDAVAARAAALRCELLRQGLTPPLVAEGFALARDACRRRLGLAHHPVQLVGGYVILRGGLAEMATGEGKTITALLPAAVAALAGVQVHVVTVNDYLAGRDAEHLRPVFALLGLDVGLVVNGQDPAARARAYAADVVYGTNKEIAFDYLRDRIAVRTMQTRARVLSARVTGERAPRLVLRGLPFAIVDEADSVLIDEARTPLIISGEASGPDFETALRSGLDVARGLVSGEDFALRADQRRIVLTEEGRSKALARTAGLGGPWRALRAREELVTQAASALHLFHRDTHYIVRDDKVQIVDESTGRVMADRQWERGLHQLVELKEGVAVSPQRATVGQITYQRFFRRYLWVGGMTGTAAEVGRELGAVYEVRVTRVPTHAPVLRRHLGTHLYASQDGKWQAVIAQALAMTAAVRPVLIGTRTVMASEELSRRMTAAGIVHTVLNARQDADEAGIIARAGEPGRITIATSMAGRGTDIRLDPAARAAGGLHVILTEYHESARIDRQLFGRAGRQGDPGSTSAIVALDDEILTSFGGPVRRAVVAAFGARTGPLPGRLAVLLRAEAQRGAEARAARARRQTLRLGRDLESALAFTHRPD